MQPIATTIVRHSTSRPLPMKTTSRRVPWMLRQIQRSQAVVNPGPADDGDDGDDQQNGPADVSPDRAGETRAASGCPLDARFADDPFQEQPGQERSEPESVRIAEQVAAGQRQTHDQRARSAPNIPGNDRHRLAGEGQVRPSRHVHARDEPPVEAGRRPMGAGMTRMRPMTKSTRLRQTKSQMPKSIDSGPPPWPPSRRSAAGRPACGIAGGPDAAGDQARNFARPLPAGHALGPDQRIRR